MDDTLKPDAFRLIVADLGMRFPEIHDCFVMMDATKQMD